MFFLIIYTQIHAAIITEHFPEIIVDSVDKTNLIKNINIFYIYIQIYLNK